MTTISNEYRELNAQMHRDMPHYGINGCNDGPYVLAIIKQYKVGTLLDFGCGKGTLKDWLSRRSAVQVQNYDPAVPEFSADPEPADMVVCTDVMEHVERPYTLDVLRAISKNTRKVAYIDVALQEAKKCLPDGRNAHINLRSPTEWFDLMSTYMDVVLYEVKPGRTVSFILVPKGGDHA